MRSTPNRKSLVIALIALIALLAVIDLATHTPPDAAPQARSGSDATEATARSALEREPQEEVEEGGRTAPPEADAAPAQPETRPSTVGFSHQKVFRMILEDGACRLDAIEEVAGDFRPRRGTEETHAGMIACRLIGADGQMVAENLVHPPDHVCVVLDPHLGEDPAKPVTLSGLGPQVFQVRFPAELTGERLEVYRITRTRPELSQTLLLTVPIEP